MRGKIPTLENYEDILTSTVFGLLKYLPIHKGLLEVLQNTRDYTPFENSILKNNPNLKNYNKIRYFFWEYSSKYGIPDIIFIFESSNRKLVPKILVLEVKFYSSKSRSGQDDQLKDYFLAISNEKGRATFNNDKISKFRGEFIGLVYLTKYVQRFEVQESINELSKEWIGDFRDKIYELRWNDISKSFKDPSNLGLNKYELNIINDISSLLKKKNFIDFEGWTQPPQVDHGPIFFEQFEYKEIPNDVLNIINQFNEDIFYQSQDDFEGWTNPPDVDNGNVFFK